MLSVCTVIGGGGCNQQALKYRLTVILYRSHVLIGNPMVPHRNPPPFNQLNYNQTGVTVYMYE